VAAFNGSTSLHAQARVIALSYLGLFNGTRWLPSSSDGYRKESSRICCAADVARPGQFSAGNTGYTGGNIGAVADSADPETSVDLGQGVFVDALSHRYGIALCGQLENLTLQSPFVLFSHGPVSQILSRQRQYDPYQATTVTNYLLAPYAFFESCIEVVGGQGGPQRILLAFGPTVQKCAVCARHSDSKFFATLLSGRETNLVPAWPIDNSGGYFDPSQTVLRTPTPVNVGDWRQNRLRLSFFRFEANSLEISSEIAARNDVAGIPGNAPRALLAGVENTTPSAMVCEQSPFDFATTTTIPFSSTTMQARTSDLSAVQFLPGDVGFENPQHEFVNSPAVLSLGHKAARLPHSERSANADTATYRKHGPQQSGTLVDEDMVLVALKSFRICQQQPPLSDDDICFPVMESADQSVFRFRGTAITGSKLAFVPWSSGTFTAPIRSFGASQLEQPDLGTTLTSSSSVLVPLTLGGQKPEALSGLYLLPTQATTYEEVATPPSYTDRLYNTTQYDLPASSNPDGHPPLAVMYEPNGPYDEIAFMAGALASACPYNLGNQRGSTSVLYGVGRLTTPPGSFAGWRQADVSDAHPAAWRIIVAFDGVNYQIASDRVAIRSLAAAGFSTGDEGTLNFMPSIAGKTYDCTTKSLFGLPLQAGLFQCLSSGVEQNKTATINFLGRKTTTTKTAATEQIGPATYLRVVTTTQEATWDGSVDHECTFKTPVVEIFVRWSASLQSPGQYKVREPLPDYVNYGGLSTAGSIVAPQVFCRTADRDLVTPILVADVWVRAVGECDVSSTYDFPSEFGTSGTYSHKIHTQGTGGNVSGRELAADLVDLSGTSFGHAKRFSDAFTENTVWPKNQEIPADQKATRYLGAFPFNRAQTQRLLDGETVTPTYWFLDDEGTALESQPVTVPWHNDTFGTYKLEFRLVTES
jgi:hypothetical protein